jgi:myosin heavy subunit
VNVVQGSNFQGKSSLIAAIRTVMGSTGHYDRYPLTENTDSGSVTLKTDDGSYEITLRETANGVVPETTQTYLTDETDQIAARLFAFLGEDNPIRKAVRNGDDFTELLLEPLALERLNEKIEGLQQERQSVERDITEAEDAVDHILDVQQKVTRLETELETLGEQREELDTETGDKERVDELTEALSTKRDELKRTSSQQRRLEDRLEQKRGTIADLRTELSELDDPEEIDRTDNIERQRDHVAEISDTISFLEDLYRVNRNAVDEEMLTHVTDVERSLTEESVACWVCGGETSIDEVDSRLSELSDRLAGLREQRQQLQSEIEAVEQRRREIESQKQRRADLEARIAKLETDIGDTERDLKSIRNRKETLETEVEELEVEVEAAEDDYNEALTDVKTQIRTAERELEASRERLDDLNGEKERLEELRETKADLTTEIERLRNEKDVKQRALVEEFNDAIDNIVDQFAPGFDGGYLTAKRAAGTDEIESFELVVAREGVETELDNLSEAERELVGLALTVAGFQAFDVGETMPAIFVDGISQLAADHLHNLVEYLQTENDMLVITAYPEAGEFDANIITPESWDVVSDEEVPAA